MSGILSINTSQNKSDAKIQVILDPVVQRVHNSLTRLHSLKAHRYPQFWKFREEYAQRNRRLKSEDGYTTYQMNTWFAIVNSKWADIVTNTPKYDFVAMDDDGKKYKRVRELFWKYIWEVSKSNEAINTIVWDALKYWVWFWEETVVIKKRCVKVPEKDKDWVITYTEKEIIEYDGCKLNPIPWNQVYLNWSNIENTTEAIIITYWDRDEFLLIFGNDAKFSNITDEYIPRWKYYYTEQWGDTLTINGNSWGTDRWASSIENDNIVSVLTCYNKYRDEYIILANDKWINPVKSVDDKWNIQNNIQPIPFPHKEIPILVYTDHILEDDIYGLGEFDITERSRQFKDDIRSLHIEWVKAQWGIITISEDSDYDETVMRLWIRQVARVDKDAFWFFAPNINLGSLDNLERKVDEDLIVETWVDYKSQIFWPSETAARTEGRIASSKRRINLNIKNNAYSFYERLARLRSANFEFVYKSSTKNLPIKWVEVSEEWSVEYVQNWYGLFTMKPEYFSWKVSLIPIVDSLFWNTSTETKQKYLETLQLFLNMKNADWTSVFDPKLLVEAWRGIVDEVIDLDKVLWKSNDTKSPEDIMKEAWIGDASQAPPPNWGMGGIPPAQQSGAPVLLGSSPK